MNVRENLWIVKPGGLSRGRDIQIFNNFTKIISYCGMYSDLKAKKTAWVVQKYVENPMLIMQRKFDFRVWVVVESWNPLMVYMYDQLYLRFGS